MATPKIAVIAVHGVAEQQPNGHARALAQLLTQPPEKEEGARYSHFEEVPLTIPIESLKRRVSQRDASSGATPAVIPRPGDAAPITVQPTTDPRLRGSATKKMTPPRRGLFIFKVGQAADERGSLLRKEHQQPPEADAGHGPPPPSTGDITGDIRFSLDSLREFRGRPADMPNRVRLEGRRDAFTQEEAEVHVHEMYWADLSRLGQGFLAMLGEYCNVLFHLTDLGRQVADELLAQQRTCPWRRAYAGVEGMASRLLSIVLPTLHLLLAAAVVTAFAEEHLRKTDPQWVFPVAVGVPVALGGAMTVWPLTPFPLKRWWLCLLLLLLALFAALPPARHSEISVTEGLLLVELLLGNIALAGQPLRLWGKVRPGTLAWGGALSWAHSCCGS